MSDTNALRPTQNPATRFGSPGTPGPRIPGAVVAPAPPVAAPPVPPVPAVPAPPEPISARVPVPRSDFHPDDHAGLHEDMGKAFDRADAAAFVREAYDAVRAAHPHIEPRAALMGVRDAWHAIAHGFSSHAWTHHAIRSFPALFGPGRGHQP